MSYPETRRSNLWFLLPILFGVIGGVIAFFILRNSDPRKAKNCLYLGLVLMMIGIILNFVLMASIPGMDPGFNVKI